MGWVSPGVGPETEEEKEFAAKAAHCSRRKAPTSWSRRPSRRRLSYGMMDSPVGAAAWIVEKFHGWSDCRKGFENVYTKDQLLTNVMIYLVTRTFNTATWMYRGRAEEQFTMPVPRGARIEKPTGIAAFPDRSHSVSAAQPGRAQHQRRALDELHGRRPFRGAWSGRTIWSATSARLRGSSAKRRDCAPSRDISSRRSRRSCSPGIRSISASARAICSPTLRIVSSGARCAPPERFGNDRVDDLESQAILRRDLHRGGGVLRLFGLAPEDRGATFRRDHRIDRMLEHDRRDWPSRSRARRPNRLRR